MGLEPTTAGTTTRSYHQLSYAHHVARRLPDDASIDR
jgi:hypothetical protein